MIVPPLGQDIEVPKDIHKTSDYVIIKRHRDFATVEFTYEGGYEEEIVEERIHEYMRLRWGEEEADRVGDIAWNFGTVVYYHKEKPPTNYDIVFLNND